MNDANDLKSALVHMPKLSSLDIGDNPLEDEGIRWGLCKNSVSCD